MNDNAELKRLAEQRSHGQMVCSAKDVLDLLDERDQIKAENEALRKEIDKLREDRDGLLEAGAHLL
ncbi:hypothetical protein [Pseudomonas shahriarae]|uniref:Uncharacterized protein n=1 Tax=Pseudomonas shahriarae TaxID=2745512 RepID=A0ABT5NEB5_9PSED|nr:hypothetical protein [Pseudomonas shahriarae]MDD0985764.1 hypothetical protein [Pseudomonas shahriarae]MDD1032702.1 hypothetical protein [Pseudomonas shahriarae]